MLPVVRLLVLLALTAPLCAAPPAHPAHAVASQARPGSLQPAQDASPVVVADGVVLFRLTDPDLLTPPGPVSVHALRLDPTRVELRSALANDRIVGTETVPDMARRHGAVAAVNAGFFLPSGDPAGLLGLGGRLVSDTGLRRGAVAIIREASGSRLVFDRISGKAELRARTGRRWRRRAIDGIDTARRAGQLMLYTPHYAAETGTSPAGVEWVVRGTPGMVIERRDGAGSSPIPEDGCVLSYGGPVPPPELRGLTRGSAVEILVSFKTDFGTPGALLGRASAVVGGAGLLVRDGKPLRDFARERLRAGFDTERHPRTLIGADPDGRIWLVTVDGRHPLLGLGMSFAELQNLAARLGLVHALNLDGGGSTTMVVGGEVVNRPSDPAGPRKVSDALLVFVRKD